MDVVTMPVRVMQRLGIDTLFLTNAAGGINPDYLPGDVMLIVDHINIIGMAGLNPLRGPNLAEFGERFPDMSQPYDRELIAIARKVAKENNILLREGVYVCLSGPSLNLLLICVFYSELARTPLVCQPFQKTLWQGMERCA